MTKSDKKKKLSFGDKMNVANPGKILKRILAYYKPYKKQVIFAIVCLLLNTVCTLIGTVMLSVVIDNCIMPLGFKYGVISDVKYAVAAETVTLGYFGGMVGFMAGMYAIGVIMHYAYNFIIVKITTKIMQDIRDAMFERMEKLPIRFFDTHTHGELMSRYTNDTDTLRELLSNSVPNLLANGLTMITMFIAMMVFSPLLTLIILVMLILMLAITKYIAGKSGKHFINQQRNVGALNGYIEEHIDGLKVVKVFCHEDAEKNSFDKFNSELRYSSKKANTYANVLMPVMNNLGYINYAFAAIFGAMFIVNPIGNMSMTIGNMMTYLQLAKSFSNPLGQMAQQANVILQAIAGGERIFELLDAEPEEDEGYVTLVNAKEDLNGNLIECEEYTGEWAWKHYHKATDSVTYVKWQGAVEFEDVTFGYVPEKTILKDVNLEAKPGQKIALVGSTGAGKTTITNLINRFYDVEDGKIRFDKINIQKIQKPDLRRSMAMVLQDTHLFTGTVRDNIRFGKLDATDEEIENAAKLANADYFISHLPDGYETVISGDGANLSQGQRQLIAIARAAVVNPPVLVLDEATSSIDTRTEQLIEQGMDQLMQGRTVFVIAHRLSTVRNADMILVIEHGEIIERGNHEQLISAKGRYYHLYTGAFELD